MTMDIFKKYKESTSELSVDDVEHMAKLNEEAAEVMQRYTPKNLEQLVPFDIVVETSDPEDPSTSNIAYLGDIDTDPMDLQHISGVVVSELIRMKEHKKHIFKILIFLGKKECGCTDSFDASYYYHNDESDQVSLMNSMITSAGSALLMLKGMREYKRKKGK